jgi:iron complex transport system ATP-binding protein
MQLLRKLVDQKNKTIVLVLHDINFAASYSDYLIALKDGRLVREGGVDEIISSKLLKEIYDIEFEIIQKNNKPMCLYY